MDCTASVKARMIVASHPVSDVDSPVLDWFDLSVPSMWTLVCSCARKFALK